LLIMIANRWVLLEHRISQLSLENIHFDLLLEESLSCKTWRLEEIPVLDGPWISAILLPPHRLEWLVKQESIVSGGRGWARRIEGGSFSGQLTAESDSISVVITSKTISGKLEIIKNQCRLLS